MGFLDGPGWRSLRSQLAVPLKPLIDCDSATVQLPACQLSRQAGRQSRRDWLLSDALLNAPEAAFLLLQQFSLTEAMSESGIFRRLSNCPITACPFLPRKFSVAAGKVV